MSNSRTNIILILSGLSTGLINGLIGIGGGTIVIPTMVFLLGVAQHQAHGTSLAVILPTSVASAFVYWWKGHLSWSLFWPIVLTGVAGAYLGARLMNRLSPERLRQLLGIVMIAAGVRLLWK
ncbi:sulfite exporter TauE/SafE family protein [Heliomicrobium undosum]|uniref:sulfite exporter TauE/SafE family protein n=1 Tax=Heliomicrobium undosum TaxID=121734 RepID=UPI00147849B4|nr:sulfite exporter TauE/SafE family protein [Heliomicrobium undosum]